MNDLPVINWVESGESRSALWRSESGALPPARVVIADDGLSADAAYRLAGEGTAMPWRGDYHNARQLLQALSRRLESTRRGAGGRAPNPMQSWAEVFHLHGQSQEQRARIAGRLDVRPHHPRASEVTDPLHAARAAEITSLWRLAAQSVLGS